MIPFFHSDFLLQSDSAQRLYHDYAEKEPIFDYHCHLSPKEIAEDKPFDNLAQIWLGGDHYKWRAMRACGVPESHITGKASDFEKFQKWAEVFPKTIGNPLFHWTVLELARPFGITDRFLNPQTARSIWEECNEKLQSPERTPAGLIEGMRVRVVCTTDDPADDLSWHQEIQRSRAGGKLTAKVLPTFRPDKALPAAAQTPEGVKMYQEYLRRLETTANRTIDSLETLLEVLTQRMEFFHSIGGRLADHGFERFDFADSDALSAVSPSDSFKKILQGTPISAEEIRAVSSVILLHCARFYAKRKWTMQLHIGAIRNNNSRIFALYGADAGCDSIVDGAYMKPLSRFLDRLDMEDALPKTIVYNLNPASNYALASMVMNFSRDIPGKMQYGAGWWFLDQMDGMLRQLETVSTMGLLSLFVGMLTDSRSFLSYTRHEYFRRILCNRLGDEMEQGLIPNDFDWIGGIVQDISFRNAERYFGLL